MSIRTIQCPYHGGNLVMDDNRVCPVCNRLSLEELRKLQTPAPPASRSLEESAEAHSDRLHDYAPDVPYEKSQAWFTTKQAYIHGAKWGLSHLEAENARLQRRYTDWREIASKKDVEIDALTTRLEAAESAVMSIVSNSHSWVIELETGHIIAPIHAGYRKLAREALRLLKGE